MYAGRPYNIVWPRLVRVYRRDHNNGNDDNDDNNSSASSPERVCTAAGVRHGEKRPARGTLGETDTDRTNTTAGAQSFTGARALRINAGTNRTRGVRREADDREFHFSDRSPATFPAPGSVYNNYSVRTIRVSILDPNTIIYE